MTFRHIGIRVIMRGIVVIMEISVFRKAVFGETADRPNPIKSCRRCGECCTSQVPLLYGEKRRIRRYIEANQIARSSMTGCPFLSRSDDGKCSCTIYPVRPMACRSYRCSRSSCDAEAIWAQLITEGELTDMVQAFYPDRPAYVPYRRATYDNHNHSIQR